MTNHPIAIVEVAHCGVCAYADTKEADWVCAADEPGRMLGNVAKPWTPPQWCTLRKADRLITLRVS